MNIRTLRLRRVDDLVGIKVAPDNLRMTLRASQVRPHLLHHLRLTRRKLSADRVALDVLI